MYTIKLNSLGGVRGGGAKLVRALEKAVDKSKFTAKFTTVETNEIHVKPIRLKEAKLYCGQHPGECQVGATRSGKWLEWEDWVEFHGVVNDVLDSLGAFADIWTNPPEKLDRGQKMWVRMGLNRRVRYEWEEQASSFGRTVKVWNHGSEDQFS